jgi:ribosome-binding protein aMBF1 (putative translation factor)
LDEFAAAGFVATGTNVSTVVRIDVGRDVSPAGVPADFVDIDDLISAEEATPQGRERLANARIKLSHLERQDPLSLKKIRLQRGLSQQALATMIGTTQPHIARIESGRCDVQVGTLSRLAAALKVDSRELVTAFMERFAEAGE